MGFAPKASLKKSRVSGVIFSKLITKVLRLISRLEDLKQQKSHLKALTTVVIWHNKPNYDRKNFLSGFLNSIRLFFTDSSSSFFAMNDCRDKHKENL